MRIVVWLGASAVISPLLMGLISNMANGDYGAAGPYGFGVAIFTGVSLLIDSAVAGKFS